MKYCKKIHFVQYLTLCVSLCYFTGPAGEPPQVDCMFRSGHKG